MKIGAIIIHSSKYTQRRKYVDGLLNFFKDTEVEVNIIEGVFTNDVYYDAREHLHSNPLSKGIIGCALAHVSAYKLAIEKDYDYVYIFEDDVRVAVPSYSDLKGWINNITVPYDLLLITNIGAHVGAGHDGRTHFKYAITNDLYKGSCMFGVMAYYMNKKNIKLFYDTQMTEIAQQRLFIGDGLPIHCMKGPDTYLDIITPIHDKRFFIHEGYESISAHVDSKSTA